MTDSPSPVLQLRIQSVGSNVNLWGGYINTDLNMIEQAAKGYQSLAVTGDATISWTNYTTGNTGAAARLKLTGSPSAAATLTFPAYHNFISVENTTAQTVTIKCSGGTGVAIAASSKVLIYCDGVDYYNAGPNVLGAGNVTVSGKISGVTAGTAATDAVNKTQMETAIATAGLPATAGTVLVSGTDTTAGYLGQKIVGSGAATVTTINSGADEDVQISVGALGLSDGGTISGAGAVVVNTKYLCDFTTTSYTITLPAAPTAGDVILLTKYGTNAMTLGLNSLKFNGSTSNPVSSLEGQTLLRYTGASRGWVEA